MLTQYRIPTAKQHLLLTGRKAEGDCKREIADCCKQWGNNCRPLFCGFSASNYERKSYFVSYGCRTDHESFTDGNFCAGVKRLLERIGQIAAIGQECGFGKRQGRICRELCRLSQRQSIERWTDRPRHQRFIERVA